MARMVFEVRLPVPPRGAGPPAASATTRPFVRGLPTTVPRGVVQDIWSQSGYGERRCGRRASAKQQQTNGKRVAPWSRVTPAPPRNWKGVSSTSRIFLLQQTHGKRVAPPSRVGSVEKQATPSQRWSLCARNVHCQPLEDVVQAHALVAVNL